MEYNAWGQFANGPDDEPTLIYMCMLSDPMDYMPGVLSLESANKAQLPSTLAKPATIWKDGEPCMRPTPATGLLMPH